MCSGSSVSRVMSKPTLGQVFTSISAVPTLSLVFPGDNMRPFDAMLRLAWDGSESAQRYSLAWGVHVQLALDA